MKKIAIRLSAIAFTMLVISGCSSKKETLFPALDNDSEKQQTTAANSVYKQANLPALGTTVFEPIKINDGANTGTFVGQKVVAFRAELVGLQSAIRKHNDDLQKIRASVVKNSMDYDKSINDVEARLQKGTTPGNPYVVASLQNAQDNIKGMTENIILTNQLSTRVTSDVTTTMYVLDSIKSTYSVSGAVDEDHEQLRILQSEAEKTNVVLNNILNEARNDYGRQQQYVDAANKTISSLEEPVRRGRLSGVNVARAYQPVVAPAGYLAASPVEPVRSVPLSNVLAKKAPTAIANPAMPQESGFSNRPLFAVKFNKENVDYKDGLNRAVSGALKAKPTMMFDVVAVTTVDASADGREKARVKATEIFQEVVKGGVNPENVSLSSKTVMEAQSTEVHIYVK